MIYPAKVLLFGEYTLIQGSQGLAIPFDRYTCTLCFEQNQPSVLENSTEILQKIHDYITNEGLENYDTTTLAQDISNGMKINMNIPIGYGLGSSGALTACIYEKYCTKKATKIESLQKNLGILESVFHGKSSGIDPLVCYLQAGILCDVTEKKKVMIDDAFKNHFHLFLVDTQQARRTAPLVNAYLEKCKTPDFLAKITAELIPLNNQLTQDFTNKSWEKIEGNFKSLSQFQLHHFEDKILKEHISIWQKGLKTDDFYLKICGAGGGGFMLGLTKDKKTISNYFDKNQIIWV